jgi:hypothetical protein
MATGECPTSTIAGYQFESHYRCVDAGYAIAQNTYRNLENIEEWDQQHINDNKIVVKFECKELSQDA